MGKSKNKDINKHFTLADLGLTKSGECQLYDKSCLNKDDSLIKFDTQVAIVTHYLHNHGTEFDRTYSEKANMFINLWTNTNITKEEFSNDTVCDTLC